MNDREMLCKMLAALKKLTAWWDQGAAFPNKLEAEQFALQSIKEIEVILKEEPDGERMSTPTVVESTSWKVWAIQVLRRENGTTWRETYAVSAESEYGAIKRYCGSRSSAVLYVSVIPGRAPEYLERRIEGRVDFEFPEDATKWIHT